MTVVIWQYKFNSKYQN